MTFPHFCSILFSEKQNRTNSRKEMTAMGICSDFHIHTSFSGDSEELPENQIRKAIRMGMASVCITDHQDFEFPPSECDFTFDTVSYWNELERLKEIYQDRIRLGIGVELGLQTRISTDLSAYAKSRPFDFIIGSIHACRNMDIYYPEFYAGWSEDEAYRTYFEYELDNFRTYDCYDVAGHLDYVVRYGPNRNQYYSYRKFSDLLDEILKTLISKGKGLECNTSGLKAGLGQPHPSREILCRYRELGGEILTVGSDAHQSDSLGFGFDGIGDFLKDCGFRYYTTFQNRIPEFHPL